MASLDAINNAFTELEAPYDGEIAGDSEIEIKVPADYGTKTLEDLSRETKEWHRDISKISEVFDPERPETLVRTLATGSWEFYLASAPLVIFGLARCLKGVNAILAELIRSRQLLAQLTATNAPPGVVQDYQDHINTAVGKNLNDLAISLVDEFYKGNDEGRRAELKNALSLSLKRLSRKLSEGSKVSLRLTKPKTPKIAPGVEPTEEERAALIDAERIEQIRLDTMAELETTPKLEHDPEIAKALPPPEPDHYE